MERIHNITIGDYLENISGEIVEGCDKVVFKYLLEQGIKFGVVIDDKSNIESDIEQEE